MWIVFIRYILPLVLGITLVNSGYSMKEIPNIIREKRTNLIKEEYSNKFDELKNSIVEGINNINISVVQSINNPDKVDHKPIDLSDDIDQTELQKELDSLKSLNNEFDEYEDEYDCVETYNEIAKDGFDTNNEAHEDLLFTSVINGYINIFKYLISKGADKNAKDNERWTPLHFASQYGYLSIVEYLISNKADINTKDKWGDTPLHFASQEGYLSIVEYLVDNGADVNAMNNINKTPIGIIKDKYSYLSDYIEGFLSGDYNQINAKDNGGNTPLHWASSKGQFPIVQYLVTKGAEINAQDNDDDTPLHIASSRGYLSIVEYLVNNGAEVNAEDSEECTPLIIAKTKEIKDFLRSHGAK